MGNYYGGRPPGALKITLSRQFHSPVDAVTLIEDYTDFDGENCTLHGSKKIPITGKSKSSSV
jgi:hypothetical protein